MVRELPKNEGILAAMVLAADGVVTLRASEPGDAAVLVAGRDAEWERFLGGVDASDDPQPYAVVVVDGTVVGWVDWDTDRTWLEPGEVNVGYNVFAEHRGRGHATRATRLLLHALHGRATTATLLIDPANQRSLALARRARFERQPDLDGIPYFKTPVPPLTYTDGVVTIRALEPEADLEHDLAAKDAEQQRWLWTPDQREAWSAMTPAEQRAHALRSLQERATLFATGPRFSFAVDTATDRYIAYLDVNLGGTHHARTDPGEANVSYSAHPAHRGNGYVRRAVRLGLEFLRGHTAVRRAHLQVDPANTPSLRVAAAVGAVEYERSDLVRHAIDL